MQDVLYLTVQCLVDLIDYLCRHISVLAHLGNHLCGCIQKAAPEDRRLPFHKSLLYERVPFVPLYRSCFAFFPLAADRFPF